MVASVSCYTIFLRVFSYALVIDWQMQPRSLLNMLFETKVQINRCDEMSLETTVIALWI